MILSCTAKLVRKGGGKVIKVGVVGGTGYTGVELLRLLLKHPQVELRVITSRAEAGLAVADLYPNLRGFTDLTFTEPDPRSEEHTSELQSRPHLVCRLLLE